MSTSIPLKVSESAPAAPPPAAPAAVVKPPEANVSLSQALPLSVVPVKTEGTELETAPKAVAAPAVVAPPAPPLARTTPPPVAAGVPPPTSSKGSKSKKKKAQVTVTMATAATAQSSTQGSQGENTGRWTAEEHRLFLQGLEQHGKGWKKIASLIKSRTVVQIRTHAQKYFQKLAKARQNGEEGDVAMEGRGGASATPAITATAAQTNKRRRQTSGTKRKAIQSVVSSAQRQGKKIATAQASAGNPNPTAPLPAVAPSLAHFVLPQAPAPPHAAPAGAVATNCVPSITTAQGTISGPALEDSLFRFLSPAPVAPSEPQVSEVARQAGANPITLPSDQPSPAPSALGGEVSPTGVADLALYPSWTDAKDTPSWYAKGSDVDALLDVADTLDWLTDTGDLHESYQPSTVPTIESAPQIPEMDDKTTHGLAQTCSATNMSLNSLPRVDSAVDVVVPPLPSLFDGATEAEEPSKKLSLNQLAESTSATAIDEHLHVFDTPLEEHDFVSTILETTGESSGSLPVLG